MNKDNLKFILMLPTFPFFIIYHSLLLVKSAIILKRRNERVTYDNVMYNFADDQCDILFAPTIKAKLYLNLKYGNLEELQKSIKEEIESGYSKSEIKKIINKNLTRPEIKKRWKILEEMKSK